ncbi:unnamed protein product [Cuscuta campestris]|uniref:Uncharacterized protein n=1 Tax=Cuscuta campestris TaxID=132261 RepID=A0A484LA95_9ASTE|nr:unnamed protein product [Cuscuta campestris]
MANFLWGQKGGSQKHHWARWAQLTKLEVEGGLRINSLKDHQQVYTLKLWWKARNDMGMWGPYNLVSSFLSSFNKTSSYGCSTPNKAAKISLDPVTVIEAKTETRHTYKETIIEVDGQLFIIEVKGQDDFESMAKPLDVTKDATSAGSKDEEPQEFAANDTFDASQDNEETGNQTEPEFDWEEYQVTTDQEGINTKTFYCLLFFVGRGADDSNPKALVYLTKTLDEGERDEQSDSFIVGMIPIVIAGWVPSVYLMLGRIPSVVLGCALMLELWFYFGHLYPGKYGAGNAAAMLLPWTVEAEFGITCCFPLDATVVLLCLG